MEFLQIIVGSGKYESLDKTIKKTARFTNTKESLEENVNVYEKLSTSFVRSLVDTNKNERVTG